MGQFVMETFCRSYTCIEGYLAKDIDNKRLLQTKQRHVRYFRIIFGSGKLNIKETKEKTAMRSFLLKDLIRVSEQNYASKQNQESDSPSMPSAASSMMTIAELQKSNMGVDESAKVCNWRNTFKIEFPERSFTLSARTRFEHKEWLRVF